MKTLAYLPMKRLSLTILLLGLDPIHAQQNGIEQTSQLITLPTGDKLLRWHGKSGRCYFVQVSDANTPLAKWAWAPLIEQGNDEEISHEVGGTALNGFFRLKFTDQVPGPGQTLETADFDGDGISNWDEITAAANAISTLAKSSLRERLAYVTQEPFLFNGTVRENLLLSKRDATDAELWSALTSALRKPLSATCRSSSIPMSASAA
jgi:hypothetical protein